MKNSVRMLQFYCQIKKKLRRYRIARKFGGQNFGESVKTGFWQLKFWRFQSNSPKF